ncbi:MAG: ribonuclease H-like domain-containing protein, partial [Armatimonadota bacterium]|nr:ribonuclease H-like domain-containing protein [Armatimonadota bacterium]
MAEAFPGLRERLAAMGAAGRPRRAPDDARHGPAFEVRRTIRPAHEVFGPGGAHPDDEGALFLDTETTGLAGGAGTTPFLIGLALVGRDTVTVEQYFLRRLAGEPAMLAALRGRLVAADTLVTFNGRRFDWPILEARSVISRVPLRPPPDHTDLIGPARRLWHRPLGTHRLTAIERVALGIARTDDVDSALIPSLYLAYLRTGDASGLHAVFAHNAQDVLCLVHLRRRVRRWVEDGEDPPPPVDWEGLGVLRQRAGLGKAALAALRRALANEDDPAARWRVAQRIARLLRRDGRWDDLLELWVREAPGRGVWRARAMVEAARVWARRFRQPERAVAALEDAQAVVEWLLATGAPEAEALAGEVRA